jgi:hypothetical protein
MVVEAEESAVAKKKVEREGNEQESREGSDVGFERVAEQRKGTKGQEVRVGSATSMLWVVMS